MLVLSRKCGESITIGNNAEIIVKVLQNKKGIVSIGIDAPSDTLIDRLEIYEKRLNNLPMTEAQKSVTRNRLALFRKDIKKICPSNDLLIEAHTAWPS